ncbi:MAG: SEC-C domain-containing protein [Acidobacteria bacterium]|nr:SEC-C domain-containing protein [Acidobacteriota bacterium]
MGRNDRGACGSGLKYKRCHGPARPPNTMPDMRACSLAMI